MTAADFLDLLILLWLVGTWFYEGNHRRCTVVTHCPKCGEAGAVGCTTHDLLPKTTTPR